MKTNLQRIQYGLKVATRQWQAVGIVYVLQLALALTLGLQAYEVLHASIGQSLEINKLLQHYDHTVVTDFLKVHGASITPLLGQLRWIMMIWVLCSVFLHAGLMQVSIKTDAPAWHTFWQGAAQYFVPFLKLTLVFLLLALCWTALSLGPVLAWLQPSLEYFRSEQYSVWMLLTALGIWALGIAVLFVWSVLSRFQYMSGLPLARAVRAAARVLRAHKGRVAGIFFGFLTLQILFTLLYWVLVETIQMATPATILIVLLLQQAFAFGRVWLRLGGYAGLGNVEGR